MIWRWLYTEMMFKHRVKLINSSLTVTRLITLTSRALKRCCCLITVKNTHTHELINTLTTIIFTFPCETNMIKNKIPSNLVFDTRGTDEQTLECFRITARAYDAWWRHWRLLPHSLPVSWQIETPPGNRVSINYQLMIILSIYYFKIYNM